MKKLILLLALLNAKIGLAQLSDKDYNYKMAKECLIDESCKCALTHIGNLMAMEPNNDSLYFMRAKAYLVCDYRDGRTEKDFLAAMEDFDTFLEKQPSHRVANYLAAEAAVKGVKKYFFIREKIDKETSIEMLQKAKVRVNAYYDILEKLHKDSTDRPKEIEKIDLEISKIQNK